MSETERCFISIKLDDTEKVSIAMKAADLHDQIEKSTAQAAVEAKNWKDKIKAMKSDLDRFLTGVQNGYLEQEVEAERIIDRENGITYLLYEGQRYQVRELTAEERQEEMF